MIKRTGLCVCDGLALARGPLHPVPSSQRLLHRRTARGRPPERQVGTARRRPARLHRIHLWPHRLGPRSSSPGREIAVVEEADRTAPRRGPVSWRPAVLVLGTAGQHLDLAHGFTAYRRLLRPPLVSARSPKHCSPRERERFFFSCTDRRPTSASVHTTYSRASRERACATDKCHPPGPHWRRESGHARQGSHPCHSNGP